MIQFAEDYLVSALTPHWEEAFTLFLVADPDEGSSSPERQLLIGVHPEAPGPSTFSISRETAIPGCFRFDTNQGSARITLPKEMRDQPAILAFQKTESGQEAFVNLRRTTLAPTTLPRPEPDDEQLPGLHLGGFSTPGFEYHGRIGAVLLYDRALSEEEYLAVFRYLRNRYVSTP
jgi:hypothetical protein